MRDATKEERESINKYVESISEPTGVNFYECMKNGAKNERRDFMKIGDKVRVKDNLKEELLKLTFSEETSAGMAERFVDTEQEIFDLWTNKDGQEYATVDLLCEIPVQCLEVIE